MKKTTDIIRVKQELKEERSQTPPAGKPTTKQESVANEFKKVEFEWQAPTHESEAPSRQWLTLWLIASFTAVTVAMIFKNFLFAFFLIIAAASILIMKYRRPHFMTVRITSRGLSAGSANYPFHNIDSFWIDYEPPLFKYLIVRVKTGFVRRLYIPLVDENPVFIRRSLIPHIKEVEEQRSLIDTLSKFLKI